MSTLLGPYQYPDVVRVNGIQTDTTYHDGILRLYVEHDAGRGPVARVRRLELLERPTRVPRG